MSAFKLSRATVFAQDFFAVVVWSISGMKNLTFYRFLLIFSHFLTFRADEKIFSPPSSSSDKNWRKFDLESWSINLSRIRRPDFFPRDILTICHFLRLAIPGLFFFIYHLFYLQLVDKILPMSGFKPQISGVISTHSTNWATTTAPDLPSLDSHFNGDLVISTMYLISRTYAGLVLAYCLCQTFHGISINRNEDS